MIKRLTPKTAFGKNVLTVMTGGGLAQAIPILMSPVLTRLYSPEDFGFMALYLWGASLLTILATGKYEKSVYLPNRTKGVARIIDMSSNLSLFFSILLLFSILFFGDYLWHFFDIKNSIIWLYILPYSVFIASQYQILEDLVIKRSEYKKLSISRVSQSFVNSSAAVGLSYLMVNSGLLVANLLGQIVALITVRKIKKNLWPISVYIQDPYCCC